ncbi:AAA family ATPase [Sphingomonas sp.]|jgi:RecA-family ATPase|uniref:AAA family ATPase n=1 Tax=Sphingomonas sp. TaxID=28214 RepID=UPI00261B408B|nr:AAA family ATPase [Sphingomonas sp.]MDF2495067.1 hypothetical protein [Sphingomonas sp.]
MGSPAENITRHFNGDWHGSYGSFPAPGHSKSDRGVTVKDNDDGDVVINSFNGADWREIKELCRAAGLLPPLRQAAGDQWRITGTYHYYDASGVEVYRTVRQERAGHKKKFVAERPNGRGGWVFGTNGIKRVLYRLPELLASSPDLPVYFVEGERKADKLASWGLVATTSPFGSKSWRDGYAAALAGRTVVVLPDNDSPGREYAEKVRAAVEAAGGRAVILELEGLPAGGDIVDWRGTADDLSRLTNAALRPSVEMFPVADLAAWAEQEPEPKSFRMDGVIPDGEVTLFTGPGGTNKSTFGLQLCAASAAGRKMLGVAVQPGNALYVTAEDEDRENHWRLRKIASAIGTSVDKLAGKLAVVSLRGRLNNELATFDSEGRLHPAPAYTLLRSTITETGTKLVVLDNVGHLFIGNENDRGQVTGFINLLYQLCRELGVTVVLIAHPNKVGDSYSGSTAWLNAVRSQIVLKRPDDGHDPDARILTLGKANYARPDQQIVFRWHDFALVLDSDLSDELRGEVAAIARDNSDDAVFLACLAERTRQRRAVSEKTGRNLAPVVFATMPEARGVSKDRLERAMDRLFRTGRIERAELWRGADRKAVFGLRETAGEGAGNGAENGAETRCVNAGNDSAETCRTHTLPLQGNAGAALSGLAPAPQAPDETAPIKGWDA